MGFRDIRPYASHEGSHIRPVHFKMANGTTAEEDTTAAQDTTWLEGDILALGTNTVSKHPAAAADPSTGDFFLAAAGSRDLIVKNGSSSGAADHPIMVPTIPFTQGSRFTTANVYNNSNTLLDLDAAVDVGMTAGLWVDDTVTNAAGHVHGIDINGSYFRITAKLDADGRNSLITGQPTVEVIFERNA